MLSDVPSKPRGRPKAFDPQSAVRTALKVFWRNGYSAVSVRELQDALNLSVSSVYNALGPKESILESALNEYFVQADEAFLKALRDSPDGLAAIEEFFESVVDWVSGPRCKGCLVINLVGDQAYEKPLIRGAVQSYLSRVREHLRMALERAAAADEIDAGQVDARAELLLATLMGLCVSAKSGTEQQMLQSLASTAMNECHRWGASA